MRVGNALNTYGKWTLTLTSVLAWVGIPLAILLGLAFAFWYKPPPGNRRPNRLVVALFTGGAVALLFAIAVFQGKLATSDSSYARTYRQMQAFF